VAISSRRTLGEYRALLRSPEARWLSAAGFAAQLTQSAGPLGLVLVTQEATGSFATAGVAAAAFAIAAGIGRPVAGRLIDRRGPAPVLAVSAVVHAVPLAVAAALAGTAWALVALAAAAGAALPQISASMRVLLGEGEKRATAFALVNIVQELAIIAGPVVLGALVAITSARAGLIAVAAAAAAGTLWFAGQAVTRAARPPAAPPGGARPRLLSRALGAVLAIGALTGAALGAVEVAAPAFAVDEGARAASGLLLAGLSAGGVVGALAVGAGPGSRRAPERAALLLALLGAGLGLCALAPSVAVLAAILLVGGLPLTPAITTVSLMVADHAPRHAAAEGFGWLSTGVAAGVAAGSAAAGLTVEHAGTALGFVEAGAAAGLGALLALAARERLERA
jgi:MFS family permease